MSDLQNPAKTSVASRNFIKQIVDLEKDTLSTAAVTQTLKYEHGEYIVLIATREWFEEHEGERVNNVSAPSV